MDFRKRNIKNFAIITLVAACLGSGCNADMASSGQQATFMRIQQQVFAKSCTSASCHGTTARAGGLTLTGADAYQQLVGAPSSSAAAKDQGLLRVVPGRPDLSFLYLKLTGSLAAGMGDSMPLGAGHVDQATLDTIEAWISAGAPPDGLASGDSGSPLNAGRPPECDDHDHPAGDDSDHQHSNCEPGTVSDPPAPISPGIQVKVVAPPIPSGTEETRCHYLKLGGTTEVDVNRIQILVSGGSHHVHLYRPFDHTFSVPDSQEVCNMAVDFNKWELVAATQVHTLDWELPNSVGYHFRPNEQVLVQTHFVNVGALETKGEGKVWINLQAARAGQVTQHAGTIFGQDKDVLVPPHSETTLSADCNFPQDLTLMAITGHYHFRGREFTANRLDSKLAESDEIYNFLGYNDPPFMKYPATSSPRFKVGEGLRWTCRWVNDTDNEYKFGPFTDTNEHCNVFGFYYPAKSRDEAIYCVKEHGVSVTSVRTSM